ncbi:MAG: hypothetical protein IJQ08_02480 [Synergistaceae bacterium]|nr:hypothetical protein [Synergistaceae bacterium]
MKIKITNILDSVDLLGEENLRVELSRFVSAKNPEIEEFIKEKAIGFAKGKLSITYILNDMEDGAMLGYFTLTHKSLMVSGERLSKTTQKRLMRYARFDIETGNYVASAFLLAQFGKNYGVDKGKRISGSEMMKYVNVVLLDVQRRIGGGIMYLDCEDKGKLKEFYEGENFKKSGERFSAEDSKKYLQYIRFF